MENLTAYILEKLSISPDNVIVNDNPEDADNWGVGDIVCGSYVYSMTLPCFYKIIKRTNKQFVLQRLKGKIVSGHRNGQWKEVADPDTPDPHYPELIKARINKYGHVRADNVTLRLWDGKPLYGDDQD